MNDNEFALLYAVQRDSDLQDEALDPESLLSGLIKRIEQEAEQLEDY